MLNGIEFHSVHSPSVDRTRVRTSLASTGLTRKPAAPPCATSSCEDVCTSADTTITFASGSNNNATITVNGTTTYQTMDGFGYTLTGGSAIVINRMPTAARSALLNELFTRNYTSLGVSYLRLSIGASDLDPAPYTYDEVPAAVPLKFTASERSPA